MPKTAVIVRPGDHGRRMSLEEFDEAEAAPGYNYELSRGTITVVEIPKRRHLAQVDASRKQFYAYQAAHPRRIHTIAAAGECKLLIRSLESERHPDLAIYVVPPPTAADDWSAWIPDLVIEVISPGSQHRDYVQKREEYLLFGVKEYWILDSDRQEMLVLRRSRGRWTERIIRPGEVYRPRLFPGLAFDCGLVFQAAEATGR